MVSNQKRNILVTAALPYANGDIHCGHITEHVLLDIYSRFQRMKGHECAFVCADDTHGTPIMIAAKKAGEDPKVLIERVRREHINSFDQFEIKHDFYGSTDHPLNHELTNDIFSRVSKAGAITEKEMHQLYCEHDQMFLPDRFVKGTCPKCKVADQYGDSCDNCGSTYNTTDLIEPGCSICGNQPVVKSTNHLFFKLDKYREFLKDWVPKHTVPEVANKLGEWLNGDLQDWCISRDSPYFGFEIPGHLGKYFYVWMDAPVGYMSSSKLYFKSKSIDWNQFWVGDGKAEVYHCIGKDIIMFHALFWPAVLRAAGYRVPDGIWVHGMLTVGGVKMSKSKGTYINAAHFAKHLDPLYFRYYLASKLTSGVSDMDWNWDDFTGRVNSELVGKITNIASRSAQLLSKLDGTIVELNPEARLLVDQCKNAADKIAVLFDMREFAKGVSEIRELADSVNKYIDSYEPWNLIKTDEGATKVVLSASLTCFRILTIYLTPILPSYSVRVAKLFGDESYKWLDVEKSMTGVTLNPFEHLIKRVDPVLVKRVIEESQSSMAQNQAPATAVPLKTKQDTKQQASSTSSPGEIEIQDFSKVDLRVAKIVEAEAVEGAEKLLRLKLDLGTETRQVFSGIKAHYKPEQLVGRFTVVVANLKPRKMKFGMSEGMVLAAGNESGVFLLTPDHGAKPGDKVT